MSIDVIDDLEAFEGMCNTLATMLRALLHQTTTGGAVAGEDPIGRAREALREWDSFCRPTCEDGDCDGIGCGCPHHYPEPEDDDEDDPS